MPTSVGGSVSAMFLWPNAGIAWLAISHAVSSDQNAETRRRN